MSFKLEKTSYKKLSAGTADVYRVIKTEVYNRLAATPVKRVKRILWAKALVLIPAAVILFCLSMTAQSNVLKIVSYIFSGWFVLLTGFNFAHDAAHQCLTKNKKTDQFIFETLFALLGANPYLWKIRHIYSHHPYPNIDGCDADIELTNLLRFSDGQSLRKMHRYQHIYAPLLYTTYTLFWICYKDFILFFRKKQANITFNNHHATEWIKLFTYKAVYFSLMLGMPLYLYPSATGIYITAFMLMHIVNSLFLLFTFLISHHVPQTHDDGDCPERSWMMQQVASSADFHAEANWACWLFGGFNAHTAHHLFPSVNHVHYPGITKIIRKRLQERNLVYHSFSFFAGVKYHLQFLKEKGRNCVVLE